MLLLFISHSAVSDSLQPHGLQHTRLPCSSPSPRACSNSCPLSQWCHPTISFSVVSFPSCLQSFEVFMGWVISLANQWKDHSNYFEEGVQISRNWATAYFSVLWQCLRTVMTPLSVSFSLLTEDRALVKLTCLPSWTHLILIGLCCVFEVSHSFKSCAPPTYLLFQKEVTNFSGA